MDIVLRRCSPPPPSLARRRAVAAAETSLRSAEPDLEPDANPPRTSRYGSANLEEQRQGQKQPQLGLHAKFKHPLPFDEPGSVKMIDARDVQDMLPPQQQRLAEEGDLVEGDDDIQPVGDAPNQLTGQDLGWLLKHAGLDPRNIDRLQYQVLLQQQKLLQQQHRHRSRVEASVNDDDYFPPQGQLDASGPVDEAWNTVNHGLETASAAPQRQQQLQQLPPRLPLTDNGHLGEQELQGSSHAQLPASSDRQQLPSSLRAKPPAGGSASLEGSAQRSGDGEHGGPAPPPPAAQPMPPGTQQPDLQQQRQPQRQQGGPISAPAPADDDDVIMAESPIMVESPEAPVGSIQSAAVAAPPGMAQAQTQAKVTAEAPAGTATGATGQAPLATGSLDASQEATRAPHAGPGAGAGAGAGTAATSSADAAAAAAAALGKFDRPSLEEDLVLAAGVLELLATGVGGGAPAGALPAVAGGAAAAAAEGGADWRSAQAGASGSGGVPSASGRGGGSAGGRGSAAAGSAGGRGGAGGRGMRIGGTGPRIIRGLAADQQAADEDGRSSAGMAAQPSGSARRLGGPNDSAGGAVSVSVSGSAGAARRPRPAGSGGHASPTRVRTSGGPEAGMPGRGGVHAGAGTGAPNGMMPPQKRQQLEGGVEDMEDDAGESPSVRQHGMHGGGGGGARIRRSGPRLEPKGGIGQRQQEQEEAEDVAMFGFVPRRPRTSVYCSPLLYEQLLARDPDHPVPVLMLSVEQLARALARQKQLQQEQQRAKEQRLQREREQQQQQQQLLLQQQQQRRAQELLMQRERESILLQQQQQQQQRERERELKRVRELQDRKNRSMELQIIMEHEQKRQREMLRDREREREEQQQQQSLSARSRPAAPGGGAASAGLGEYGPQQAQMLLRRALQLQQEHLQQQRQQQLLLPVQADWDGGQDDYAHGDIGGSGGLGSGGGGGMQPAAVVRRVVAARAPPAVAAAAAGDWQGDAGLLPTRKSRNATNPDLAVAAAAAAAEEVLHPADAVGRSGSAAPPYGRSYQEASAAAAAAALLQQQQKQTLQQQTMAETMLARLGLGYGRKKGAALAGGGGDGMDGGVVMGGGGDGRVVGEGGLLRGGPQQQGVGAPLEAVEENVAVKRRGRPPKVRPLVPDAAAAQGAAAKRPRTSLEGAGPYPAGAAGYDRGDGGYGFGAPGPEYDEGVEDVVEDPRDMAPRGRDGDSGRLGRYPQQRLGPRDDDRGEGLGPSGRPQVQRLPAGGGGGGVLRNGGGQQPYIPPYMDDPDDPLITGPGPLPHVSSGPHRATAARGGMPGAQSQWRGGGGGGGGGYADDGDTYRSPYDDVELAAAGAAIKQQQRQVRNPDQRTAAAAASRGGAGAGAGAARAAAAGGGGGGGGGGMPVPASSGGGRSARGRQASPGPSAAGGGGSVGRVGGGAAAARAELENADYKPQVSFKDVREEESGRGLSLSLVHSTLGMYAGRLTLLPA